MRVPRTRTSYACIDPRTAVNEATRSAILDLASVGRALSGTHSRGVFEPGGCGGLSTGDPVLCHPRLALLVPFYVFWTLGFGRRYRSRTYDLIDVNDAL